VPMIDQCSKVFAILFALLISSLVATEAKGDFLVYPETHNSSNAIPFWPEHGDARYQQVFDSGLYDSGIRISELAFSPVRAGALSGDVVIRMGVTDVNVGELSESMDMNISGSMRTVFDNLIDEEFVDFGTESFSFKFDIAELLSKSGQPAHRDLYRKHVWNGVSNVFRFQLFRSGPGLEYN